MKKKRQDRIMELIEKEVIETQEELSLRLNAEGFKVTQATVSRDIRELNLIKAPDKQGHMKYVSSVKQRQDYALKYVRVLREGTEEIGTAAHLLVIKTVSGMAMAVAAALDGMDFPEIVGSIAGDDTIFCAVKSGEDAARLLKKIREKL